MYIEKGKLDRIIDPSLNGETPPPNLKYFAKLANNCLHPKPKERPTMSEVVESLEIALVSHERKGRSQGTIAKVFQGMDRLLRAGKGNGSHDSGGPILDDLIQSSYPRFSLARIHAATNDFNAGLLIGRGSCFNLYKGCMVGGTRVVMIKRYLSRKAYLAGQVSAEIGVQSLTHHPNIVSLIGFCEKKHELILVYDYMVNGTLKSHLHRSNNDPLLWKKRLEICIDTARGLEYLHTNVEQQFVHRDLNSSNILLDDKWVVKIAGFQLSVPIPTRMATEGAEKSIICEMGHFGSEEYLDPEYLHTGKVTKKTDVYAFGVLLLEVLCAETFYSPNQNTDEISLIQRFRILMDEAIDPYLIGKIAPECFRRYVNIALSCVVKEGIRRPSMNDVLRGLESSLQMQLAWENFV